MRTAMLIVVLALVACGWALADGPQVPMAHIKARVLALELKLADVEAQRSALQAQLAYCAAPAQKAAIETEAACPSGFDWAKLSCRDVSAATSKGADR